MILQKIINFIHFIRLKKTKKSRQVLRNQNVYVNGKKMNVMRYIDYVNSCLPKMIIGNTKVDHLFRLRKIYFKYDLPGIKYYIRLMSQVKKVKQ